MDRGRELEEWFRKLPVQRRLIVLVAVCVGGAVLGNMSWQGFSDVMDMKSVDKNRRHDMKRWCDIRSLLRPEWSCRLPDGGSIYCIGRHRTETPPLHLPVALGGTGPRGVIFDGRVSDVTCPWTTLAMRRAESQNGSLVTVDLAGPVDRNALWTPAVARTDVSSLLEGDMEFRVQHTCPQTTTATDGICVRETQYVAALLLLFCVTSYFSCVATIVMFLLEIVAMIPDNPKHAAVAGASFPAQQHSEKST